MCVCVCVCVCVCLCACACVCGGWGRGGAGVNVRTPATISLRKSDSSYCSRVTDENSHVTTYTYAIVLVECCFTSTETIGLLGTGAQDGHFPSLISLLVSVDIKHHVYLLFGLPPRLSHSS